MSKGLELFQQLRKSLNKELNVSSVANDNLDIIEKELNDYEKLQNEYEDFENIHEEIVRHYNALYKERFLWLKEHRALEIINNKNVSISVLKDSDSVEEYNQISLYATKYSNHYSFCKPLTQEEYYLLKEVLL